MNGINYKLGVAYGSVEFAPCAPGFSRLVTRDGNGKITKDVTKHYVCIGLGGGNCIYCGRAMGTEAPKHKLPFWRRMLGFE